MFFVPAPSFPPPRSRLPTVRNSSPIMTIPKSVKQSKILIVGGGPTGSALAAHLHKRAIPSTLVEKQSDFTDFDVTRAYCLNLDYRAGRVLQKVDGLFEHLSRDVQSTESFRVSVTDATGKNVKTELPRRCHDVPDLCDIRPGVVDSLKRFVTGLDGFDARYGVGVKDIQIADDGSMTVTMDTPEGETTHTTRLLLACDGRNSKVGRLLEEAESRGQAVHAPYGHGVESFDSPAVGLSLKSIVLNEDVINEVLGERDSGEFMIRSLAGDPKRGFEDIFRITIFPAGPEYTKRLGGFVGTMVRQTGHKLWKLKDVESGYEFFQANFPQLDMRKAITEKEMRRFVEATPSKFGDIRRRKSLAVKTGKGREGGAVVFLGDSAHAFPPDIGQGVCAAVGDVGVLMETLDQAEEEAELMDVMMRYDEVRSDEGRALMKLSRYGSPYQYGVYKIGGRLWAANFVMRKALSKVLPGLGWPQMSAMINEDISYREIVRRGDVTTRRLVGGATTVAVALLAVLARFIAYQG